MIFGQAPPPVEQDPVYTQPCFSKQCNLGTLSGSKARWGAALWTCTWEGKCAHALFPLELLSLSRTCCNSRFQAEGMTLSAITSLQDASKPCPKIDTDRKRTA